MFWLVWFRIVLIVIDVLLVWWLLMINLCWLWLIGISVLIVLIFVCNGLFIDWCCIILGVIVLIGWVLVVLIGFKLLIGWFNELIICLISVLLIGIFMILLVWWILLFLWILV